MNKLFEQIPKILQESGDLFGFVSLIVIVSALLCYTFYLRANQADKNRVFTIILLRPYFGRKVLGPLWR